MKKTSSLAIVVGAVFLATQASAQMSTQEFNRQYLEHQHSPFYQYEHQQNQNNNYYEAGRAIGLWLKSLTQQDNGCRGGYWAHRPLYDQRGRVVGYSRPFFF